MNSIIKVIAVRSAVALANPNNMPMPKVKVIQNVKHGRQFIGLILIIGPRHSVSAHPAPCAMSSSTAMPSKTAPMYISVIILL